MSQVYISRISKEKLAGELLGADTKNPRRRGGSPTGV